MYRGSSRGAGLGVPLMTELADDLHISCDAVLGGTCVQATFQRAAYPAVRPAVSCEREHAELVQEYLRVLGEVSASLRDDSQAVLAQATQAVAQARQRQLERRASGGGPAVGSQASPSYAGRDGSACGSPVVAYGRCGATLPLCS